MYALAAGSSLVHVRALHWALALVLVIGYVFYVRRHLRAPGERELEDEARSEFHPLHLWGWLRRVRPSLAPWTDASPDWPMFVQTVSRSC
jgi:hypothetical protein